MSAEIRKSAGVGSRLLNLISLIPYLSVAGDLLKILHDFAAVEDPWTTAAGLKARLLLLVQGGKIITAQTPSPEDDALVAQLETLANNDPLVGFIASLIARFKTENPAATADGLIAFVQSEGVRESLAEAATEQQIDWNVIMEAIQLIVKIIAMFKTSSGGSTPAAAGDKSWGF